MLRHMRMRQLWLLASVALTTACTVGSTDCTAVGASPQVGLMTADGAVLPDGYSAEVCSDDACNTGAWKESGRASVELDLPDSGTVVLVVRTLDEVGQVVDEGSVEAEVESFSPNGESCGPTVGVVQLLRAADGALTQVPS